MLSIKEVNNVTNGRIVYIMNYVEIYEEKTRFGGALDVKPLGLLTLVVVDDMRERIFRGGRLSVLKLFSRNK